MEELYIHALDVTVQGF